MHDRLLKWLFYDINKTGMNQWEKFYILLFDAFSFLVYYKYMSYTELSNQFTIGEDVFYPSIGICSVINTEERNGRNYLKLGSQDTEEIILLPVENAVNLGLRHLVKKEELFSSLEELRKIQDDDKEWKHRVEKNTALLKDGTIPSTCKVISSLYRRSKIKALPSVEKKLYDKALVMLVDEASSVLKKSEEEVRKLIFTYLERSAEF